MDKRRRDCISPLHFKTLHWIYEPPRDGIKWDDLSEWLRSGSGMCWISGKAGSGKSILMKFVHSYPNTKQRLEAWVGENGTLGAENS